MGTADETYVDLRGLAWDRTDERPRVPDRQPNAERTTLMTDDLDQSLLFILAFFLALAALLTFMVYLESSLDRPKPTASTLHRWVRRLRRDER